MDCIGLPADETGLRGMSALRDVLTVVRKTSVQYEKKTVI